MREANETVNENAVEESIISLLQGQGYEFADPSNDDWIANRKLDEFINEENFGVTPIQIKTLSSVCEDDVFFREESVGILLKKCRFSFENSMVCR